MAVTILDVAKLCGYSKATVSRAFASPEQVSDKTREKVYAAARALNYTPDAIARAMVRGRTDNIGFVIYESSIRSCSIPSTLPSSRASCKPVHSMDTVCLSPLTAICTCQTVKPVSKSRWTA
ncbi:MAG: LacI family DNA-binding transcriptional regulator [Butyricicoccus pullicaecorum]